MFAYSVCDGVKGIQPKSCRKNKLTEPPDIGGISICSKIRQRKTSIININTANCCSSLTVHFSFSKNQMKSYIQAQIVRQHKTFYKMWSWNKYQNVYMWHEAMNCFVNQIHSVCCAQVKHRRMSNIICMKWEYHAKFIDNGFLKVQQRRLEV